MLQRYLPLSYYHTSLSKQLLYTTESNDDLKGQNLRI